MLFPPIETPDPTWIDAIGNLLLLGAGLSVTAFAVFYGTFFAWRTTPAGRAVLYFVTGLVALLAHFIVSRFMGGDYLFRDIVRAVVYGYLMIVSIRLLVTLYLIHRAGNHPSDPKMLAPRKPVTNSKERWEHRLRNPERGARP